MKLHKLLIFALLLTFFSHTIFGQSFDWLKTAGGSKSDKGTQIVCDPQGNTYSTGYLGEGGFFGSINVPTWNSSKDVFICKQDPNGTYLWAIRGTSAYFDDRGLGICLDPFGNIFVTGTVWGDVTFGALTNSSASGSDQIFVVKLDNNGVPVWLKNSGNSGSDDHGLDLVSDKIGNIYVTGFVSNEYSFDVQTAVFDGITIPVQPYDSICFVGKLSPSGLWQWVKTFGGEEEFRDNKITIDDEDNIYITGGFNSSQLFGTDVLSSVGGYDIYVVKYDNAGIFQWSRRAGSDRDDRGNDIAFDGYNHLYITGEFRNKAGFGTDSLNNNGGASGRDMFVAKISKSGNWIWAKKGGSKSGSDRGNGVTVTNKGLILITGTFKDTARFGPTVNLPSIEAVDSVQIFVAAIDSTGTWKWALKAGGSKFDNSASICSDTMCNAYIVGHYEGTYTAAANSVTSFSKKDIYMLKIKDVCPPPSPPVDPEPEPDPIVNNPIPDIFPIILPIEFTGANVFSPNNDKINDVLQLYKSYNGEIDLLILNRWGEIVFKTKDAKEYWNGGSSPDGTYFYKLRVLTENKEFTGFVTLLR